jgi:hypothetical protein
MKIFVTRKIPKPGLDLLRKEYDLEARGAPSYFCKNGKASDCCEIESNGDNEREAKLRELRRTYYTPV